MTSLLDIVPVSEKVPVPGREPIEVHGLKASEIADILRRHPNFQRVLQDGMPTLPSAEGDGAASAVDFVNSEAGMLIMELLPPIIAAGCGYLGNEAAERNAAYLPMASQMALFNAIMRLTNPEATASPLASAAGNGAPAASGREPDTNSPSQ